MVNCISPKSSVEKGMKYQQNESTTAGDHSFSKINDATEDWNF